MHYDIIVIGVGSMGASTCYHLANKGLKVLGIEQFGITHELGSHTGESRLIRKAYFEHPDYVPLLQEAYQGWKNLESLTKQQFYWPTGIAYFGSAQDEILDGTRHSAQTHNLNLEELTLSEAQKRWPQFNIPSQFECLYEPQAGFITPERTIAAYVDLAKNLGVDIITQEQVLHWDLAQQNIIVQTSKGQYTAQKLVITAGAYAQELLPDYVRLTPTIQYLGWAQPVNSLEYKIGNFPCWMISEPGAGGPYYGFPVMPEAHGGHSGIKIALHKRGSTMQQTKNENEAMTKEAALLNTMIKKYLPSVGAEVDQLKKCRYTYSQDEHFILDTLPEYNHQVIIGTGFSGHGFKFVPVIGQALADLTLNGGSKLPIDFLKVSRFKSS